MAFRPDLDHDTLCEAALAILGLTAFPDRDVTRAWKGMDWNLLDALYERGWIYDPRSKAKSVVLTESGAKLAVEFRNRYFGRRKETPTT
jgi:hypothetical protein